MQYSTLLALLSSPLLALAQNAFEIPDEGLSATGGQPLELNWEPTTDGTVTLVLRSGSSNDLNEGTVIASNLENSGSYTWTPSNSLTRGSDYTVEIVDDDDPSNVNYTPYFVLDTDTTVAQQTSVVSLGQPTTTPDLSTASPTGAASTLTDIRSPPRPLTWSRLSLTCLLVTDSTRTNAVASASESAESAVSSAVSSAASSASEAVESAAASASEDLTAPQQSGNAGSKNTAMVGVLGALALGAAAL